MTGNPTVSVIIATYNWSTVLPYAIGSVLNQTFPDLEVLVIGDGCTDDSESVVRRFSDPRVRWTNLSSNSGHQAAPNNIGLNQARGTFVAYLGHDDLWLPNYLESQLATFDAGADVAFAIVEMVEPGSHAARWSPDVTSYTRGMGLAPTGVMHRKHVTDRIGGWRPPTSLAINPDTELWMRAYDAGFRFSFTRRLGAIKFPAAKREGVYAARPCHEQAAWSRRIASTPGFEAAELARLLYVRRDGKEKKSNAKVSSGSAAKTGRPVLVPYWIARRMILRRWSSAKRLTRRLPFIGVWQQRRRIRRRQSYKGLDTR